MRCANCRHENPPSARFCIFCGSPLAIGQAGNNLEKSQNIETEIRQLRGLVAQITSRLDALERGRREVPAPPPLEPVLSAAAQPVREEAAIPVQPAPPIVPAAVEKERTPAGTREWEQVLGGNWLARIGVVALIIGIGFFLKYAFDNNWVGPAARVIIGVVAGLMMLGLGNWWRSRYPVLTQVLSGGGIAVLYLSIFASFATYHLIGIYLAVFFLLVISVISAALARRYDSMALAILGILGAFFAPFILGAFEDRVIREGGSGQAVQLLIYIIVVDIGVLMLATFRNWRWFNLLSLGCTLITYGVWYGEFHRQVSVATAEVGITVIFIIFVGATSLFHIVWRRIPQAFDYLLVLFTAAAYSGISLGLMWGEFRVWMGGFVLLLAMLYGLLSYFAYRRNPDNTSLSLFALGTAVFFFTAAIPIQVGDKAWTTIAWAAEFVLLIWMSFRLRIPSFRNFSYAVFLAMGWRLLFYDTTIDLRNFTPVLNERFLAFAASIVATYLAVYILWKQREGFPEWHIPASTLVAFASVFTVWILSFEVWQSFSSALRSAAPSARQGLSNAQNLTLTAVWAVYAVVGLIVGIWKHWRAVRIGSLAFLAVPIVKVFIYDVFKLVTSYRIGAFVGLGVLLLVSAYLYQRYSQVIKGVFTEK